MALYKQIGWEQRESPRQWCVALRRKNLPSRTEISSLTNIQTHWIKALADLGCCPLSRILELLLLFFELVRSGGSRSTQVLVLTQCIYSGKYKPHADIYGRLWSVKHSSLANPSQTGSGSSRLSIKGARIERFVCDWIEINLIRRGRVLDFDFCFSRAGFEPALLDE